MKSNLFDDYLCAENSFQDFFKKKRNVKRVGASGAQQNPKCQWRVLENKREYLMEKASYEIRNEAFNESLSADWNLLSSRFFSRKVYLSQARPAKLSRRFKWFVDCREGEFLWA